MANRRQESEYTEKKVVGDLRIAMNLPLGDIPHPGNAQHPISSFILSRHPVITDVQWIGGGDYTTRGDVLVMDPSPTSYELKVVKSGIGTMANVSEKIFQLVDPTILSWMEWEEIHGIRASRYAVLENHLGHPLPDKKSFVAHARKLRDEGNEILNSLSEVANAGKVQYLAYALPYLKANSNRLAGIITAMTQGHHTSEAIKRYMVGYPTDDQYHIIVHNTTNNTVSAMTPTDRVVIQDISQSSQQIVILTNLGTFAIVANYKNVAQGVDTPCFLFFWR